MIADGVLKRFPALDRHGFCVGNIAPDCNIENEDWTVFTPSREITHWMQGERKQLSDCDSFCDAYLLKPVNHLLSREQHAFYLGYYAHLIADAAFQLMTRDEERVRAVWKRIKESENWRAASAGMDETWDSVKKLIPAKERMREIYAMEADYLVSHPDSGYLTEILPLKSFPDYIDYLPPGAITRKIHVMGYLPQQDKAVQYICFSQDEYTGFVKNTIQLITEHFVTKRLL